MRKVTIGLVYDIPIATNRASADFMITSPPMEENYTREVENFQLTVKQRSQVL